MWIILAKLILQGGDELGVGVAQGVDGDAAQTVQVLLAVDVPDAAALAMRQGDRQAAVGVHDMGKAAATGVVMLGSENRKPCPRQAEQGRARNKIANAPGRRHAKKPL